jgi:hypothetical protein
MANYKVPQDVEAEDKLLGPFTFRQVVYLMIAAGLIALGVLLFQLFPLLSIIPFLPAILFIILSLPLKKDQPMETYLAAIVSYHLKPRKRLWVPGQRESSILITAPKIDVEESRVRDITGEEATHRLSFLADIVDSGGHSIRNTGPMRDDLAAEANATTDMFEAGQFSNIDVAIKKDAENHHREVLENMRAAIERNESIAASGETPKISRRFETPAPAPETPASEPAETRQNLANPTRPVIQKPNYNSPVVVVPNSEDTGKPRFAAPVKEPAEDKTISNNPPKQDIIELANNPDFSVATIAKQAKRINERKDDGEVFISLH